MNILIISDQESPYLWDYFDKEKFKHIDLIISCGDLKASYLSFLVTMIPVPLLYVPGNHDTRYVTAPPEGCICIDEAVFEYKGLKIAGLGGCMEYTGGVYQYTEPAMAKRVKKLIKSCNKKGGLDILITHAPTFGLGDGEDQCHKGFNAFYNIYSSLNPKYHIHGHQHLNYTSKPKRIREYEGITLINGFNYHILEY